MRRWFLWVAGMAVVSGFVAGCGGEESCAPECRAGFVCYYGRCVPGVRDAGDASPGDADIPDVRPEVPGDDDGDGVVNADDNCPTVPNPDQADCDGDDQGDACDQDDDGDTIPDPSDLCSACDPPPADVHDEDGDGMVDVCDNCPEVANVEQTDADADGVGDLCEFPLDPSWVGERTVFMSFAVSAGLEADGGDWRRGDDMLRQVQTFGDAAAYSSAWTFGNDMMVRAVVVWRDGSDPTYRLAGMLLRVQRGGTPPTDWYYCAGNVLDDTVQIWSSIDGSLALLAEVTTGFPLDSGVPYRIVGAVFGDQITCVLGTGGGAAGIARATASAPISGGIGVRTVGTAADFLSVTAYR